MKLTEAIRQLTAILEQDGDLELMDSSGPDGIEMPFPRYCVSQGPYTMFPVAFDASGHRVYHYHYGENVVYPTWLDASEPEVDE